MTTVSMPVHTTCDAVGDGVTGGGAGGGAGGGGNKCGRDMVAMSG